MNVLQESKQVSFCVYVCACMCRNEAKVLMKAQGSSVVGFKIITSVHKGNSSLCVCVCVCVFWLLGFASFLCKSKSPIPSCVFFLFQDECCCSSFIYSSFHPPFSFLPSPAHPHSLFYTSPISSSVFRSLHHSPLFFLTDHLSFFVSVCHSVFLCVSLLFFSLYVAYNLNYLCLLIFRSGKKCRRVKELKMTGVAWMEGCEEMSAEIPLCCVCSGFLNESLLNIYQRGNEILIKADNPISQM